MNRITSRFLKLGGVLAMIAMIAGQDLHMARTAAAEKGPVTVLERERLGGYIEETTFIPAGPFANHIAMSNGYEVLAVPINAGSDRAIKKLFNSAALDYAVPPKGMAYIESERAFAFVEGGSPTTLFVADRHGNPLPPRTINYLPGPLDFLHNEALLYLPPSSPIYPDHLLMIANRFPPVEPFIESTIEVLRRDGQVVARIIPPSPLRENYLTGLALKGTNQLLIGLNDQLWTIDFDGQLVSGPVTVPGPFVEGLEQLPDGRIVMSAAARLYFFDQNLNRLPQDDRNAGIGLGLLTVTGIGWNSDTDRLLLQANLEETGNYFEEPFMMAIPTSLDSAEQLFEFDPANTFRRFYNEYLPDEDLIATSLLRAGPTLPAAIALYDLHGQEVEQINLTAFGGSPLALSYIPQTNQFAVVFRGAARDQKIVILSRTGAFVREIDLAAQGINQISTLTAFNPQHPSGGQFLIFGSRSGDANRAIVTDFQGQLLSEFNYREAFGLLSVADAATITSGPLSGAFSVLNGSNDNWEVVIFKLN
jgi:hypothetical protein